MANTPTSFSMDGLVSFAESLGLALGQGIVRGMNAGLAGAPVASAATAPALLSSAAAGRRRPGRPPKLQAAGGPVPADKRCKVEGCESPSRSKGLCSKHYQAERRRQQGKNS